MIAYKTRNEALSGAGLNLYAQMEGGIISIVDHLDVFCNRIQQYGLKPWGRKGREYLNEGIKELEKHGAYDSWTKCDKCHNDFFMSLTSHSVDLFLSYWRGKIGYEDFMLCHKCGGEIEKS